MNEVLLTLTQALQLVGIAPCLLVICYLLIPSKYFVLNILPITYFISLLCSFTIPLASTLFSSSYQLVNYLLLLGADTAPALSYLLILQYITNRLPSPQHFIILASPLIGGSSLLYNMTLTDEVCFGNDLCFASQYMHLFYNIASSCLIFMLLVIVIGRIIHYEPTHKDNLDTRHKYWLIISLILVNLCLLALDLGYIAENILPERYLFIQTLMKLTFIYLVLTSMFRVFTKAFAIRFPYRANLSSREKELALHIEHHLKKGIYREPLFNRAALGKKVGINEYQTSRIINMYFHKSFSDLINEYRVEDIKKQLVDTNDSITTIAFDAGYNSIASFNRVFKELAGMSPSEYREKHKAPSTAGT